jgi:O-antigen ligase
MGEIGIVGGAAYIALWATALWAGWHITSRAKAGLPINLSLFLALIAIAVANLGENMFEGTERQRLHSIAWIVAALIVAEWNRGRLPHPIEHAA